MNQLYEFGSTVDIIIRAKNEIKIGDRTYERDEVCAMFEDIGVLFNYSQKDVAISGSKIAYNGYRNNLPQSITTTFVPITTMLADLMLENAEDGSLIQAKEKRVSDSEGTIILRANAQKGLFVYDANGNKVTYTRNFNPRVIEGLNPTTAYTILYLTEKNNQVFGLEQCHRPYFEVELVGRGNTDKKTNEIHFLFPSVKIDIDPNLTLTGEGIIGTTLTFNIIYNGQPKPVVVFN